MRKKLGIMLLSCLFLIAAMPGAWADDTCIIDVLCLDNKEQPISGAVVEVWRENNGTYQQETTNEQGKAYFEVYNGNYTVIINKVPSGYRPAEEKYYFYVKGATPYLSEQGFERTYNYETITFINEIEVETGITQAFTVYTTDDSNKPLAGVELTLKSKSKTYALTSDQNGQIIFNVLKGRYTLEETKTPEGYKKNKETHEIFLNDDGIYLDENSSLKAYSPLTLVHAELTDELNSETTYEVEAYVHSVDDKLLEGAVLTLTSESGKVYSQFTNKEGKAVFKVPEGEYLLKQTGGTEFFAPVSDSYQLTVGAEGIFLTDSGSAYSPVVFINPLKASSIADTTPESLIENSETITAEEEQAANTPAAPAKPQLITEEHLAYLNGYADGSFGASRPMTRAEAAVMFNQLLAEPADPTQGYISTFSDVPAEAWYSQAVSYLAQSGIINGYSDNTFQPNATMTRAEFLSLVGKFTDLVVGNSGIFTDVPNDYWAAEAINSAANQNLITGYADGSFLPQAEITRAEVVTIMNKVLQREADPAFIEQNLAQLKTFNDCLPSHWAYYAILEAANGHDFTLTNGVETWTALQ